MSRSYVEVELHAASPPLVEQLIGVLSQLGFEGFWEDGESLKCYMSSSRWEENLRAEVESVVRLLLRASATPIPTIRFGSIPDQNWNERWERSIRPIHITPRIVVAPTWHTYKPQHGEILLTIDPKMSFGTGYHESTRLAACLLEKYVREGGSVLDVGTGTGILAIAAVRLGAGRAVGIDIDNWAFTNARENARLNHVQERITFLHGELETAGTGLFTLVIANIERDVIERLLAAMTARLERPGIIILSGLLASDRDAMVDATRSHGLSILEEVEEQDWIAIAARTA